MASLSGNGPLNPGEEKVASPPNELPPPYVEGETYQRENSGLGKQEPAGQSNLPTQPLIAGTNYNVAGGYATGPYSNPYDQKLQYQGPMSQYQGGPMPLYQGGPMVSNVNSTHLVVTQPGSVVVPINRVPINDYTEASIFSAVCCCLCLGIVAILASGRSKAAIARGDYQTAKMESDKARNYVIASIVFGVVLTVLIIVLRVVLLPW